MKKNFKLVVAEGPKVDTGIDFGDGSQSISKAFLDGIPAASRQDSGFQGRKEQPFNFDSAEKFKVMNVHHSACIDAKREATVGLGFHRETIMETVEVMPPTTPVAKADSAPGAKPAPAPPPKPIKVSQPKIDPKNGKPVMEPRSKVSLVLDPLCRRSFADVMARMAEDLVEKGTGYIEVTRGPNGTPLALYHCPAKSVFVVVEDEDGHFHYEVQSIDGSSFVRVFADFGDLDRLKSQGGKQLGGFSPVPEDPARSTRRPGRPKKEQGKTIVKQPITELISFQRPSSRSKHYGFPDWLAAVLAIELKYMSTRHLYDFFLNRGVPELLIMVSGAEIDKTTWDAFQLQLKAHIGLGKSHKTMAFNIPDQEVELKVEKLAMEGQTDGLYVQLADGLGSEIVSAHGVPPLLAGIQIPGKLGANNELANAMQAFQALRVGPLQHTIETTLQNTLGKDFPEITEQDWKLRTILDELNIQQVATIGGMKQPLNEATAAGRDLSAGPLH